MTTEQFENLGIRVSAARKVKEAIDEGKKSGLHFPGEVDFWVTHTLRQLEEVQHEENPAHK